MIGVGLVGLGEIGQVHLAGLRESSHCRLVSICDVDPGLVERSRRDERAAASLDEMLSDDDVSVIDICLPHHLHAPFALRAIGAGRHVLLEKPMAMSVEECDRIIAAAEGAGVIVGVSHNQLFYGPHVRLAEMLDAGEMGSLRTVRARLAIGVVYATLIAAEIISGSTGLGWMILDAGRFLRSEYVFVGIVLLGLLGLLLDRLLLAIELRVVHWAGRD